MSKPCPICGGPTMKVIYCGLPGRLCEDERCCCLDGLAAYAPPLASETYSGPMFAFMPYEGSYLLALWRWLFNPPRDDD